MEQYSVYVFAQCNVFCHLLQLLILLLDNRHGLTHWTDRAEFIPVLGSCEKSYRINPQGSSLCGHVFIS